MTPVRLAATAVVSSVLLAAGPAAPRPQVPHPLLGLAIEFAKTPRADVEQRALAEVRRTGVSLFALKASWPDMEPAPGKYRVAAITRTARLLRQSGATLHLDLPLVTGRARELPRDLTGFAFDDARLSERLGKLLEALGPALADISTISLGYEADAFFANRPEELKAYRRLFEGAIEFLHTLAPRLSVGVTTSAPTESVAPEVAEELHRNSPVLFYIYSPFVRGQAYVQRDPAALESDWQRLLDSAGERPFAFPEVSFSSSPGNGSSPEKQAEFVRRMRRFLAASDGRRLLFARYVGWRDPPPDVYRTPPGAAEYARRQASFFSHRGLQESDGRPKPAWKEWVNAGR